MQCELYTASVIVKTTQQASLMASYTKKTQISEGRNTAKPSKHSAAYVQKFRLWWAYSLNTSTKQSIYGSFGFTTVTSMAALILTAMY